MEPAHAAPTPVLPLPPLPPSKPTSRARTYRIPNTSDAPSAAAAAAAAPASSDELDAPSPPGAPGESHFLWATREIAALDFLMNVPLGSEKDIVRAGLGGGRWHPPHPSAADDERQDRRYNLDYPSGTGADGVDEEGNGVVVVVGKGRSSASSLDAVPRSSGAAGEDESAITAAGTADSSSIHAVPHHAGEHHHHHHAKGGGGGAGGRWWDRLVLKDKRFFSAANQQAERRERLELEEGELERPTESPSLLMMGGSSSSAVVLGNGESSEGGGPAAAGAHAGGKGGSAAPKTAANAAAGGAGGVPGRRLDGREAVAIAMPDEFRRRPPPLRAVARQAAVREWEIRAAYDSKLLDGRIFFSARRSYPAAVFSTIKYEPRKEETLRRRKQLEELGGGGTTFVLPERDWRGISYRALLPQGRRAGAESRQNRAFNRLLGRNAASPPAAEAKRPKKRGRKKGSTPRDRYDNTSSSSSSSSSSGEDGAPSESSSDESATGTMLYPTGFLDDPHMCHGKNRNVMMGDKVTGPIISSTIQFVKPSVLKADLNKQFRERFDQWEPPKGRRRYIGARVIDGVYTLIDPTDTTREVIDDDDDGGGGADGDGGGATAGGGGGGRGRTGSVAAEHERETIRMPPSLTLSKIRRWVRKRDSVLASVIPRLRI